MMNAPDRAQLYAHAVSWMQYHWHQARAHLEMSRLLYMSPEAAGQYAEWAEDEAFTARFWARNAKRYRRAEAKRRIAA